MGGERSIAEYKLDPGPPHTPVHDEPQLEVVGEVELAAATFSPWRAQVEVQSVSVATSAAAVSETLATTASVTVV